MGYNPQGIMNIYEIIRRWHSGQTISAIAKALNLDRKTVRRYIKSAQTAGIAREAELPVEADLLVLLQPLSPTGERQKPAAEQFDPYREELLALVGDAQEPLTLKSAWQVITHRHREITASYSSLKRVMRSWTPSTSRATWRHETPPGVQAQIDYGKMGLLYDPVSGRNRVVYAFIGTLSWSRYKFVEFVWGQDQQSFVSSHINMGAFWGGMSQVLVIDCLKSGVLKPDLYDPHLNPLYRNMAEHYGCFVDPARPGRPKDKGKVERAVQPVRDLFRRLKAMHPGLTLAEANTKALQWCRYENGMTPHGTTGEKPWECFQASEADKLLALPDEEFQMAQWKQVKVHVDQFVQFEKAYYSVAKQHVGRQLWLRADRQRIELYDKDFSLVKTYQRKPGRRFSDPGDFPDNIQAMMNRYSVRSLIDKAAGIGPDTARYVEAILHPHAMANLRKAMGVVDLAGKHPGDVVEAASRQALAGNAFSRKAFKRLLEARQGELPISISPQTRQLTRPGSYFVHTPNT
jgi:transposase